MTSLILALFFALSCADSNPPRDLLSLLDGDRVLQKHGLATDEASLLALVDGVGTGVDSARLREAVLGLAAEDPARRREARQALSDAGPAAKGLLTEAAKSPDPEVRVTARELLAALNRQQTLAAEIPYAAKLLALQLLERRGTDVGVDALTTLSQASDLGLADGARRAVAIIGGSEPAPRPTAVAALTGAASRIPADAGFVGLLDFVSGAGPMTLADYVTASRGAADAASGPSKLVAAIALQVIPRIEEAIVKAVNVVGNVRIDGVAVFTHPELASDAGHVACIVIGRYDPERVAAALAGRGWRSIVHNRRQIYSAPGKHAVCCIDAATFLAATAPRPGAADAVLRAMIDERDGGQPDAFRRAVALLADPAHRAAAAGAFSDKQKATVRAELAEEYRRERQRRQPAAEMALSTSIYTNLMQAVDAVAYQAVVDRKGAFELTAVCETEARADAFNDSLVQFEKQLRERMRTRIAEAPAAANAWAGGFDATTAIWDSRADGRRVVLSRKLSSLAGPMMFPMMLPVELMMP